MNIYETEKLLNRINVNVLGKEIKFIFQRDIIFENGRFFIQAYYNSPCTKTGENQDWKGRKWYLSDFMTEDEIVKTAWCAVEAAVKHETMEGFKVDGKILFNPHVNFEALLSISDLEIKRS